MSEIIEQSSGDDDFFKLSSSLKKIAKLSCNEKLYIEEKNTFKSKGLYNLYVWARRKYITNESRKDTVEYLKQIINDSIKYITEHSNTNTSNSKKISNDKNISAAMTRQNVENLKHDLQSSLVGLKNLISTYEDDKDTVSEIECLVERIDGFLKLITSSE